MSEPTATQQASETVNSAIDSTQQAGSQAATDVKQTSEQVQGKPESQKLGDKVKGFFNKLKGSKN